MYPDEIVQGDALRVVLHNLDYVKKSRTGLYDENILCASCDHLLGQLDEYGKNVLLGYIPRLVHTDGSTDLFVLDNVDIAKLIRFFLSVLWRFSISKREETKRVSIGEKFENKIRNLLYYNSGNEEDFPMVISRYKYQNDTYKKVVFMPTPAKKDGLNYYQVYFPNGYKVLIKVDSRNQHPSIESFTLKSGRSSFVLSSEYFEETDEYKKTSIKVKEMKGF